MAVISLSSPRSRPGTIALDGTRTYTVTHMVLTDDAADGPRTVMAAVVDTGTSYNYGNDIDTRAYCISKQAEQVTSDDASETKTWNVTLEFSTLSREQQKRLVSPLARPYEISYSHEHFQEVVEKDVNDQAILNTAGEYFDPPIERDASRPVLTITRNEAEFPTGIANSYANAINSDYFQGGIAGTVKVFNISGQRVVEEFDGEEIDYWKMTYEFHYKKDGWQRKILSQGRSQLVLDIESELPKLEKITYENSGDQVVDPVPLDEDGARIDPEDLPDAAYFIPVDVYESMPFSAFGFF